ncbi:MAG: putative 7-carboxy-7-deazaguanine synthase QueE [Sarcina sp.]
MKIVEIFQSIDGEAIRAGLITNFIRVAGCNLRCSYCDTKYALLKTQGEEISLDEILKKLDKNIKNITLTGGEPLWNKEESMLLLDRLIAEGYSVSVETNGAIDLTDFIKKYPDVVFIVDYKVPSSNMEDKMNINNFNILREIDCVKFVVGTNEDLEKMKEIIENTNLKDGKTSIFVSPVFSKIDPKDIVEFLLDNKLNNVRLQIQMHKVIWDPNMKGV